MSKIAKVTTLLLFGALVLETGTATAQGCPGDMNGDRNVSVSELVTAVTSALEGCPFPDPPRFVDNRNGTITDRTTRLMWEKKVNYPSGLERQVGETVLEELHNVRVDFPTDGVCTVADQGCTSDSQCTRHDPNGGTCDLSVRVDVLEWVDELNRTRFANHSDWRLPTVHELMALYDYDQAADPFSLGGAPEAFLTPLCEHEGCTDLADPACSCTEDNSAYQSTTPAYYRGGVMSFNFGDGVVFTTSDSEGYARAVRSIAD